MMNKARLTLATMMFALILIASNVDAANDAPLEEN